MIPSPVFPFLVVWSGFQVLTSKQVQEIVPEFP